MVSMVISVHEAATAQPLYTPSRSRQPLFRRGIYALLAGFFSQPDATILFLKAHGRHTIAPSFDDRLSLMNHPSAFRDPASITPYHSIYLSSSRISKKFSSIRRVKRTCGEISGTLVFLAKGWFLK